MISQTLDSLNPGSLSSTSWVPGNFSLFIITSTRGKAEEMKEDEIQVNQFCHLLAAQLASIQGGGGCSSSVGSHSPCYSRPPCCQAILSGKDGDDLWDDRRKAGGTPTPKATSSKKREKVSHRVAQILLNKLMFGLILSPQS